MFADYVVESLDANQVYLEMEAAQLSRALRAAQGAMDVLLRLSKRHNLPCLVMTMTSQVKYIYPIVSWFCVKSDAGKSMQATHEIPCRVLHPPEYQLLRVPKMPPLCVRILH